MRWWPMGSRAPDLEWIQVEVTSRCNASCTYCPRTSYARQWRDGEIDHELFRRLLPQLRKRTLVYLQGWGEPLLHHRLVEMIQWVKQADHPVATTTNGVLLDRNMISRLAGAGLDILGISLAGVDARNDAIRKGTSALRVLRAIEGAAALRERGDGRAPRIHVAYMLLRSEMGSLPEAVRVLGDAGADQIVVSSLDLVPDEGLRGETLWDLDEGEGSRLLDVVRAAEEAARSAATEVLLQLGTGEEGTRCPENSGHSVYVGFDGAVLPCVMAALPLASPVTHWGPHGPAELARRPLGSLHDEPLATIWNNRILRKFRRGIAGWGRLPDRCRECGKLGVRRVQGTERESFLPVVFPE